MTRNTQACVAPRRERARRNIVKEYEEYVWCKFENVYEEFEWKDEKRNEWEGRREVSRWIKLPESTSGKSVSLGTNSVLVGRRSQVSVESLEMRRETPRGRFSSEARKSPDGNPYHVDCSEIAWRIYIYHQNGCFYAWQRIRCTFFRRKIVRAWMHPKNMNFSKPVRGSMMAELVCYALV